ncbi:hypothetical protein E2562_012871 [Oryza meyeriana var. granulata]|uniref:Uncharacterized protein n=1 Tax=Oryza meyeriana var. granulata TaxID=110450 RepID=A0A6G1CPU7_9ORYZ|nr:hypothetical protein E2562_012871 [Oryza meyeriana var. granulata]
MAAPLLAAILAMLVPLREPSSSPPLGLLAAVGRQRHPRRPRELDESATAAVARARARSGGGAGRREGQCGGEGAGAGSERGGRGRGGRRCSASSGQIPEALADQLHGRTAATSAPPPASTPPHQLHLPPLATCLLGVAEHLQLTRPWLPSTLSSPPTAT